MSGGTSGVEALDAAGADPPADRHPADDARAGGPPGQRANRSQESRASSDTALWCSRRSKTKILSKGVLMVYKTIQWIASRVRVKIQRAQGRTARHGDGAATCAAENAHSEAQETLTGDLSA